VRFKVHLLGTSALDRFRGYVGQSRGQFPTHTWNTKRLVEHEHGAVVDARRTAAEEVLAAMGREPMKTFAACDDPWLLHRQLHEERRGHVAALEGAPPFVRGELIDARSQLARAEERQTSLAHELQRLIEEHAATSPLVQLRRGGRRARADAEARLVDAGESLRRADREVAQARALFDQLIAAHEHWQAFEKEHSWRRARVVAIDGEIAHHWARTTLTAVREDDPLAFGIDELRRARATYAADLNAVLATLPTDRSGALRRAEADAPRAEEMLRFTRRQVAQRADELHDAQQRRWGRRDKMTISKTSAKLSEAEADLANARQRVIRTGDRLADERASEASRHRALETTQEQRAALLQALREIDAAFEATRVDRVIALAHQGSTPFYLLEVLGEVPLSRGGQRAWCGLAAEIERYRDVHGVTNEFMALGADPEFAPPSGLDDLIENGHRIVRAAHELDPVLRNSIDGADNRSWMAQIESAVNRIAAECEAASPQHVAEAEPDIGLGW
jgi:hypothetical protein